MPVQLDQKTREFVAQKRFAVIATLNADGTPQQTVIWYELQGNRIMMNTAVGRIKEKNLKRDPRISFCVEENYRYVTIRGTVELDYDHDRSQADIRALATRYEGPDDADSRMRNDFSKQARVTIYMSIDAVDTHV